MTWLIVLLIVVAVVAAGVWVYTYSRTAALKRRFGPEYDRVLEAHDGARRDAEADLRAIARRRDGLDIRPLAEPVRTRYVQRWREAQVRFVDEPSGAVRQADMLVVEVLRERGYPADDEDEGLAVVSADYPDLVANYRTARGTDGGIDACREAFLHLRELFDRLVEPGPAEERSDGRRGDADADADTDADAGYGSVVAEPEPAPRRIPFRRDRERTRS